MDFGRLNLSSLPLAVYLELLLIFERVAVRVQLIDCRRLLFVVNRPFDPRSQRWNRTVHNLLNRFLLLLQLSLSLHNLGNENLNL